MDYLGEQSRALNNRIQVKTQPPPSAHPWTEQEAYLGGNLTVVSKHYNSTAVRNQLQAGNCLFSYLNLFVNQENAMNQEKGSQTQTTE